MPRALVIAHEPDGPAGQVEVRLVERGWTVDTHVLTVEYDAPNDFSPLPDIDGYDLLLPMGSVRSLTNKAEIDGWVHDELEMIRSAHEAGTPVLGICFGGQLIAEALGGSVETAPVTEIGWYKIEANLAADEPDAPGAWLQGPWLEWHHDRFTPPASAIVLAHNENAVQLFRVGKTVATQFHPEVSVRHIENFVENVEPGYLEGYGTTADEIMAATAANETDNFERCNALVDWFLDDICG